MNGVHDMGGMHGFGPVVREVDEPRFHAHWEARMLALDILVGDLNLYNLDEFRYGIERMPPGDYLRASYYERWVATAEYNLVLKGILTQNELDARVTRLREHPEALQSEAPAREVAVAPATPEHVQPASPPRFVAGDAVVVRNVHPRHHTRMPRYVRGKRGVVQLVHEPEIFPDTHAHGLGAQLQTVYNVRFNARELWGTTAAPNESVSIDLWEQYLEPTE
jgi:nitrile hydratase beta subunit